MQQKDFKKLQALWDKKLADSGFVDAESRNGSLKDYHSFRLQKTDRSCLDPVSLEAKESYYRFAGQFLHSHTFGSEVERTIWTLHGEGLSVRNIGKHLGMPTMTVHHKLARLVKEMEKSWNRSE